MARSLSIEHDMMCCLHALLMCHDDVNKAEELLYATSVEDAVATFDSMSEVETHARAEIADWIHMLCEEEANPLVVQQLRQRKKGENDDSFSCCR